MTKPDAGTWVSDNVRLDVITHLQMSSLQQAIERAVEEGRLSRKLRVVICRVQPRIQSRGPEGPLIRDTEWDTAAAIVRAAAKHNCGDPA